MCDSFCAVGGTLEFKNYIISHISDNHLSNCASSNDYGFLI